MSPYHPWRELRALSHIVVHWAHLRPGWTGATDGQCRIWLAHHLDQAQRRSTLAHELEHIRRGHRGCQPVKVERAVEAAAARRLVPDVHHLADALAWSRGDLAVAAEELWVDEQMLRARLDRAHLHPAEAALLKARVESVVGVPWGHIQGRSGPPRAH